jgi:hypothetical protein
MPTIQEIGDDYGLLDLHGAEKPGMIAFRTLTRLAVDHTFAGMIPSRRRWDKVFEVWSDQPDSRIIGRFQAEGFTLKCGLAESTPPQREYSPGSTGQHSCGPLSMTRVILFLLLIIFQEAHSAGSQGTGEREGSAKGKDLVAQCTGCHNIDNDEKKVGPSLKGLFKRQKLLNGSPATDANIRVVIKRGRGGMPAYENILTTDQLDLLVAFLKRH